MLRTYEFKASIKNEILPRLFWFELLLSVKFLSCRNFRLRCWLVDFEKNTKVCDSRQDVTKKFKALIV